MKVNKMDKEKVRRVSFVSINSRTSLVLMKQRKKARREEMKRPNL